MSVRMVRQLVHGGAEFQRLGDTTAFFDGDDNSQVIGSIGIGFSY